MGLLERFFPRAVAPRRPAPSIPAHARFRRSVGLEYRIQPCQDLLHVDVTARRHGGDSHTRISLEDARLLSHLSHWRTHEESGAHYATLVQLVEDNLLFFGDGQPTHPLSGAPLDLQPGTRVRLRQNVWPTPVVDLDHSRAPFPFMPRMGTLQKASLTGLHLGVMEMGMQVLGVGMACCHHHGKLLRGLVPQLGSGVSLQDVDEESGRLLHVLAALGLLEEAPPASAPVLDGPQVTWLGHAAVLLELAGKRVLVDPLFHPASTPHRPQDGMPPDPRTLGRVDAVLITHGDNDHCNPQALQRLPTTTPVFIPKVQGTPPHQVDMRAMLRVLGFSNVTQLETWEQVDFQGISITATPFVGEDWGLPLANTTYLLHGGGRRVYLSADAVGMPEVEARIAQQGVVDLALLGVGGCQEAREMPPGFGYGNFYTPFMDHAARNEWLSLCAGPRDAANSALRLNARQVFGYAAGGAPWVAVAYSDQGSHAQLRHELESLGEGRRVMDLLPGVASRF